MPNVVKRNAWKIIIVILLCLNLISTSWVVAIIIKNTIHYSPVGRELESYEEFSRVADYLSKNGKLKGHSFGFNYEGDEFYTRYFLSAWRAKEKATDNIELLSPKKCSATIYSYVILKNYKCGCPEHIKQGEGCLLKSKMSFLTKVYPFVTVNESDCIIIYESLISEDKDFPEITNRSLLTVERYDPDLPGMEYTNQYNLTYDGTPILRFETCVEADDKIISLFLNHLVVFEQG